MFYGLVRCVSKLDDLGFQEVKSDLWFCFFEVRQVSILFIGLMLIMVILLSNMPFRIGQFQLV